MIKKKGGGGNSGVGVERDWPGSPKQFSADMGKRLFLFPRMQGKGLKFILSTPELMCDYSMKV